MSAENNKTILLVEDEAILAMSEKKALEKYGYNIIIVNSGEEAIETVKNTPDVNLILMDIDLGKGIDGTEAAARILKDHDIPVVFCSSHTEPEIVDKTEKITSYGYVVKSSSNTVLDASIKMAFKLFNSNIKLTNELSHRRQMEEDLIKSEGKYRGIIDSSPMGIHQYELKKDGKLIFIGANPAADKILGVDNSIFIGKTIEEAFPPLANTEVPARYKEVAKTGIQWHTEQIDYADEKIRGAFYVSAFRTAENTMAANFLDITELKKAEESIKSAEALYQNLVETSQDLIWQCDSEGRYTYLNPAWEEIFGYKIEEMLGKKFSDFQSPVLADRGMQEHAKLLQGNILKGYETIHIGKNGKEIHLVFNAKLLTDKHGNKTGTCGTAYDITERKNSEKALKENNELLLLFIKNSPIYTYIKEVTPAESRIIMASENYQELIGIPWTHIIGRTMEEMFPPEVASKFTADDIAVAFGGNVVKLDEDLNDRTYSTIKFPFTLGEKKLTAGYSIDITERKQAQEALRESENKYKLLFDKAGDAIFIHDENANILAVNYIAYEKLGYTHDELIAKTGDQIDSPEEATHMPGRIAQLMEHGSISFETIHQCKDGSLFPVEVHAQRIVWNNKPAVMSMCRDISDRKKAEEEIKKQLSEKETLLREVHHRIKNNIASIEGLLSLQAESTSSNEVKIALQDAVTRVQSMRVLYEKLLISSDYYEVSIKDYIESLIDSFIEVFPESKKIIIEKRIMDFNLNSKEMIPVGIIINELITNIMKYAFIGRDSGLIKISLDKKENHVALTIQDNGIGLPEEFDMNKSTGFGLMIVRMLVQQLSGTYTIESNKGTRSILKFDI